MPDPADPIHEPDRHRFRVSREGDTAVVEYVLDDRLLTITHTLVPPPMEGQGIAGALVRAALEYARAEGFQVRPACSYADAWMRRHPEFDALRAR